MAANIERPKNLVRGDKNLAECLGVNRSTIVRLNMKGKLDDARYKIGSGNAYDLDVVKQLLKY